VEKGGVELESERKFEYEWRTDRTLIRVEGSISSFAVRIWIDL